jgi:hypothetical protein
MRNKIDKPKSRKCIKVLCGLIRDRRTQEERAQDPTFPELTGDYSGETDYASSKYHWTEYNLTINRGLKVYLRDSTGRVKNAKDVVLWCDGYKIDLRPQEQEQLQREIQKKIEWRRRCDQCDALDKLVAAATTKAKPEPAKEPPPAKPIPGPGYQFQVTEEPPV